MIIGRNIDQSLEDIKIAFDQQEQAIIKLREENKQLRDEHFKDKELKKMKEKLKEAEADCSRGFPISIDELRLITEWYARHIQNKHNGSSYCGTIGGGYTYTFAPTSIGIIGTCYCSSCKTKADEEYREYLKENNINSDIDKKRIIYQKYDCEVVFQDL